MPSSRVTGKVGPLGTSPVGIEVWRGGRIESRHRISLAVVDSKGSPVMQIGDVDTPVFPRSAAKPLQALPLVESGAADAFGVSIL